MFYNIYYDSIKIIENNKNFLPVHVTWTCEPTVQSLIKNEINKLKLFKKNFICVEEFTNEKNHYHLILLEPFEFNLEKKFFKKRRIVNILQFLNVLQYITKEVFIKNDLKKNNLIIYLNDTKTYSEEKVNLFINLYVKYYH